MNVIKELERRGEHELAERFRVADRYQPGQQSSINEIVRGLKPAHAADALLSAAGHLAGPKHDKLHHLSAKAHKGTDKAWRKGDERSQVIESLVKAGRKGRGKGSHTRDKLMAARQLALTGARHAEDAGMHGVAKKARKHADKLTHHANQWVNVPPDEQQKVDEHLNASVTAASGQLTYTAEGPNSHGEPYFTVAIYSGKLPRGVRPDATHTGDAASAAKWLQEQIADCVAEGEKCKYVMLADKKDSNEQDLAAELKNLGIKVKWDH